MKNTIFTKPYTILSNKSKLEKKGLRKRTL